MAFILIFKNARKENLCYRMLYRFSLQRFIRYRSFLRIRGCRNSYKRFHLDSQFEIDSRISLTKFNNCNGVHNVRFMNRSVLEAGFEAVLHYINGLMQLQLFRALYDTVRIHSYTFLVLRVSIGGCSVTTFYMEYVTV